MLTDYSNPLIIKTKNIQSILVEKFGKYLPILASLSVQVRIIHNEDDGEI